MNRIHAGYVIGAGLVALGPIFGFFVIGPCYLRFEGGVNCYLGSLLLTDFESFLLSWGLTLLGIGVLVVCLLLRSQTTKGGTAS